MARSTSQNNDSIGQNTRTPHEFSSLEVDGNNWGAKCHGTTFKEACTRVKFSQPSLSGRSANRLCERDGPV